MKKTISLILAVMLLCGALTLSASAATPNQVYSCLKQYAMAGEHNSDMTVYKTVLYLCEDLTEFFRVEYYTSNEGLEATYCNNQCSITLCLPKGMATPWLVRVSTNYGNGAGYLKQPGNYTPETNLKLDYFVGGSSREAEEAEGYLTRYFPTLLEYIYLVIYDSGYNLKDLGFSKFNRHTVHIFGPETVVKPATCIEQGTASHSCRVCGVTQCYELPIDPTNHAWDQGEMTVEPRCQWDGVMTFTCTRCNSTRQETIPALGHAWTFTEVLTEGETLHDSTGLYTCTRCNATKEAPLCAKEVFTDMVKKNHWAHDAIDWAYFSGLTGGTGDGTTFSPNKIVTRGEVVTFLYTIKGKPEVEGSNPFTDVKKKDFYYNPVLWAVSAGITGGTTETTFSPKKTCTRAEIVMFLWAAAGRPEPESTENRFTDLKEKDYYYKAVLWAVENGVTGGVDETHFGPKADCTRAQVMTFLRAAAPILPPD